LSKNNKNDQTGPDDTIVRAGDVLQFSIPVSAAIKAWLEHDKDGLKELAYSLLLAEASVQALKHTIDTIRPNGRQHSFPSGHTSKAFVGATVLRQYGLKYAVPAYIAAGFVGYSRVHGKAHYTRDVIAGAAIAEGSHWLVHKFFSTQNGVTVSPLARETGVTVTVKF